MSYNFCDTSQAERAVAEAEADGALAREQAKKYKIAQKIRAILKCSNYVKSHGLEVYVGHGGGHVVKERGQVVYHGYGTWAETFIYGAWIFALDEMADTQSVKAIKAHNKRANLYYKKRNLEKRYQPQKG